MTSSDSDTLTVRSGTITKIADPDHLTIGERGTWSIQVLVNPNVNFFNAAIIDQLPAGIVAVVAPARVGGLRGGHGRHVRGGPVPARLPSRGPTVGTTDRLGVR